MIDRFGDALKDFLKQESAGGIVLIASAVLALIIANSPLAPAYFGTLDGGVVAMVLLSELSFDPRSSPPVWVLRHGGGAPVHIPVTATGAEALFDAFEQLPGLDMQRLLALREHPGDTPVSLWRVSSTLRLG